MRTLSPKLIIKACQMAFDGKQHQQIAKELGVNSNTITNWKKTTIWEQTQTLLVEAYIKKSLKKK